MAILLPISAFVLRIIRLDYRPLWWDEGRNIFFANLDWQTAAHVAVRSGDVNPPVYRMLLGAWMWLVGPSPFAVRLLSVFVGVVTVALLYRFAADAYNWRVGAIAGVLSVFAPPLIYYSQEGKGYALMVLAAVWSSWAWYKIHSNVLDDRKSLWGAIGIATFIGAGAHYFYFLFVLAQNLWTVVWCWSSKSLSRTVPNLKHLAKWMAIQLLSISPILFYGWSSVVVLMTTSEGTLLGGPRISVPSLNDLARWGATTTLESANPYSHLMVFLSELCQEIFVGPYATHGLGLIAGLAVATSLYMGWTKYSLKAFSRINLVLWESNVEGTRNIANAAIQAQTPKLVFTSSNCLWGQSFGRPVRESDSPNPIEIYGLSKWEAEKLLLNYSNNLDVIILRCPTIIDEGRLGLLAILFEFIDEGRTVWTVGPGRNRYQFVYAADLANACLRAMSHKGSRIFNVGSDNIQELRAVYQHVIEHAGTKSKVRSLPKNPSLLAMRLAHWLRISPLGPYQYKMISEDFQFDTTRIKQELEWQPTLNNSEMLLRAYKYYHEHRTDIIQRRNTSSHRKPAQMGIIRLVKWLS